DAKMVCGYNWSTIGCLYEQQVVDINYDATDDAHLTDSICYYLTTERPFFTFFSFGEPDEVGHQYGWESPEYFEMSKTIDSYVGRIMQTLEENGMMEESIILFTADHGGIGKGHGSISMTEMQTPWVVCGKGIKAGYEIPESVMVFDTAPTLGYILGIHQPQVWIGRPVMSIFE
ncbi:MAG: alkaline phosphatase, partial [Alistipes sp.]|nr:alkaline phosphatase [Alistipes sp.]